MNLQSGLSNGYSTLELPTLCLNWLQSDVWLFSDLLLMKKKKKKKVFFPLEVWCIWLLQGALGI
jgi:hypothetical protein